MKDFKSKVAVITGAADGIGLALAERCAQECMKVNLADIEIGALFEAEKNLKSRGVETLAVKTDVSQARDVQTLADKTIAEFGAVHLLCNNAGVGGVLSVWESTLADWQWILGVNLWGVIYGLHYFVPVMIEQDFECHIVNTASIAGLITNFNSTPYTVNKHGIVALSEVLYRQLQFKTANVGVSVLCPVAVKTGIIESEQNRPEALKNQPGGDQNRAIPNWTEYFSNERHFVDISAPPEKITGLVLEAIANKKFYIILGLPVLQPDIRSRWEYFTKGISLPLPQLPPK
jgi:NAD(P)-dependent dehydrogenase (short-subunit alcohol dehydrogenase family)